MGTAIVRHHRPRPPGVSEHAHQEDEAALCPRSFASGWAASPAGGGRVRALLGSALGNERVRSEPTSSSPPPPRRCGCGRQPEPGRRSPSTACGPGSLVPHPSSSGSGPVAQLGANAHGEVLEPGRVSDCYLGLLLNPPRDQRAGRVLVVAPASLLHPCVPQPGGTLLYELVTGHPDRAPHELVAEGLGHEVVAQQQCGVAEGLRPTSSASSASSPSQERIRSPSTPNRKGRRRSGGCSWCMPATTPPRRDRLHSRGGEGRQRVWTP
jgi:hypothetical protein